MSASATSGAVPSQSGVSTVSWSSAWAGVGLVPAAARPATPAVATAAEVKKLRRLTDALFMGVSSRIGAGGRLGEGPKRPGGAGADAESTGR